MELSAITHLRSFQQASDNWNEPDVQMPVWFIGHGNPMNALEDNEFTRGWRQVAATLPKPTAILVVSAHWETRGTLVTAMEKPRTIHDFGDFPQALFDTQYPAPGSKWLAEETGKLITTTPVGMNETWGFDHGTWSILKHLYPNASIPVVQLSLDYTQDAPYHYNLAVQLQALRRKGVLLIGSGNMVHNFNYVQLPAGGFNQHFGLDWALEANEIFKQLITSNNHQALIGYRQYSKPLQLAAPTPDHYLPLLYALALRGKNDPIAFFNDALLAGSFSMTSVKIG